MADEGPEWTTLLCTPSARGASVSTQHTANGERVLIRAPQNAVAAVRDAALQHSVPVPVLRGRGVPEGVEKLPGDTRIRTDLIDGGIAVTYSARSTNGCAKIREVVDQAVGRLGSGRCVMLVASSRYAPVTPVGVDDQTVEGAALECD